MVDNAAQRARATTAIQAWRIGLAAAFCVIWELVARNVTSLLLPSVLGVALAIKGMINGEMLVASTGIAAMIRKHRGRFEPEKVLALLLVVVAVARRGTGTLRSIERRIVALARCDRSSGASWHWRDASAALRRGNEEMRHSIWIA